MTTKEQERQAIGKIRKIVEGMGENSYLGTAMEGVLETAEENIKYDMAFSLKERAEVAEEKAEKLREKNDELWKTLEDAKKNIERLDSRCSEAYSELQRYTIPKWMQRELNKMVETGLVRSEHEIKEAADGMADAIGEDGRTAAQAAEQAKKYKEQRTEQSTLSRMKDFLVRYKENEQD